MGGKKEQLSPPENKASTIFEDTHGNSSIRSQVSTPQTGISTLPFCKLNHIYSASFQTVSEVTHQLVSTVHPLSFITKHSHIWPNYA